ncbi:response regulator [Desulfotalea psychrophila]|uniref:Related to two-component system response regulator (Ntr family) n=1 Tax=Desulfotalea psychrophila (strain LSv54 / DSM 12343) TaxID=177439 RepID=Q6AN57_DESPS|nr:response regulator [Desulfotalea psychrophila]CAG36217.1 related to two-component system response regulator (Ntr family) [Desulfotalea psychrophila LSv54]
MKKTNNKKEIKVLIVDDEIEFADTLMTRLNLRQYKAEMASSGQAAIDLIGKNSFDVIIVDLRMPDINGLELLSYIKGKGLATEVIILTGHGSSASGSEGIKRGAFDYLMKPVDFHLLLEKIEGAFTKSTTEEA